MADALKFMIELVDKMTGPATRASLAVKNLDSNLIALKRTIGELSAMPELKFKMPKVPKAVGGEGALPRVKAGALPKGGDPNATGAQQAFVVNEKKREQAAAKAAKEIERARKQEAQALKQSQREHDRGVQQQLRISQRGARELEKAQKLGQRNILKNQQSALKSKKLAEKEALKRAKEFEAAQAAMSAEFMAVAGTAALAATAVLAVGAAFVALTVKGMDIALAAAEAKGDTLDMLEAMLGTQQAAQETYSEISLMTRDLAASQASLSMLAQELSASGVDNKNQLLASVKAIAQVDSVLKGSGAKIQGIIEKAVTTGEFKVEGRKLAGTGIQIQALYAEIGRRMGIGVEEVEKQMKAGKISAETGIDAMNAVIGKKFGPLAAKQALDFGAQMQRMKDNFGKLFEDVNTGPFLEAFSKIVAVFDKTTPAGKAMTEMLTKVFDGLFVAAGKVLPYVTTFLKGLVLMGLKVWNALRPLGKAIGDAFGGENKKGPQDFTELMVKAAEVVGQFTAAMVEVLLQEDVWKTLVGTFRITATAVDLMWRAVSTLVGWFITVELVVIRIIGWLASLGTAFVQTGVDIIEGLIRAMSDPSRLYEVATKLATGVLDRFKKVFEFGSPSKVMFGLGGDITEGLARGIDSGARAANDNMGNVINMERARAAASEAPTRAPAATGGGGGASVVIQFGENAININGTNLTMEEVREQFPAMFADAVELMLLSQGGGESVGRTGT